MTQGNLFTSIDVQGGDWAGSLLGKLKGRTIYEVLGALNIIKYNN